MRYTTDIHILTRHPAPAPPMSARIAEQYHAILHDAPLDLCAMLAQFPSSCRVLCVTTSDEGETAESLEVTWGGTFGYYWWTC